ncbi:MAG: MSMEG_4193 family putative phosphomutase [Anaerolineae bacterium]|nr:MSMEG_4193 family putative phosphomutase [Anaerolineae bacterium]
MTELLLIRHAINDWVKTGRLAGWTPGVHLNPDGQKQAQALGKHLADAQLAGIYASPLERTMETAEAVAAHYPALTVQALEGVGEVRYGDWQGAKLDKLRKDKLWGTVQNHPSRVQFPNGETIRQAQARAVDALEALVKKHPNQRIAVVSHSDVIKLIVAHYIGAHIDLFQRIEISPASTSIIWLGMDRPFIRRVNDTSYLPALPPPPTQKPAALRRVRQVFKRRPH